MRPRSSPALASLLTVTALSALAGCTWTPKNGDTVTSATAPVGFEGLYPDTSAVQIQITQLNRNTGNWDPVQAPLPVDSTPHADAKGENWYSFNQSLSLLQGPTYWKAGSGNTITTQVQVTSNGAYNRLFAFPGGAQTSATTTCVNANLSLGGAQVALHCGSITPITLSAPCGGLLQDACIGGIPCTQPFTTPYQHADGSTTCNACGNGNELCCGGVVHPCLFGDNCGGGYPGTCSVSCGHAGEPCCDNGGCATGLTCNALTCK